MCISGAIFEYEASHVDEKEKELKGWGFDVDVLRASEGGVSPLLDRRSPRAFSTNVSNDLPELSEEEWCNYAGMPSPSAYIDNRDK